ncbi:GAF domain-containing protein [Halodurantibacterium flavum]|uniref:GAF domain-containing protein n=1 Tax=Halodurantibacterium flavum TaxID=1382802 RepID=A0ABW4S005_9RHOB
MHPAKAHVERVLAAVLSPRGPAMSPLVASWSRSVKLHGLDPAQTKAPVRLDDGALRDRREAQDLLRHIAGRRLDDLFGMVGGSGCAALLCDADGIALERRCRASDRAVFESWGLCAGADWSEAQQGTNGIGTCLTERRRVIIDRDEHFMARNTAMSCIDAPIFGAEGQLLGALDVSSARSDQTEGINRLIAAMVAQTARNIEAEHFRMVFPAARILQLGHEGEDTVSLLAVDADDLVIGATRGARRALGLVAVGPLTPVPAADLLGQEGMGGFHAAQRSALIQALTRAQGNVSKAARGLGIGRATLYRQMKRLGLDKSAAELSRR